jgi:hypothetical protein
MLEPPQVREPLCSPKQWKAQRYGEIAKHRRSKEATMNDLGKYLDQIVEPMLQVFIQ